MQTTQFKKLVIYRALAEFVLVFLLQYTGLTLTTLASPAIPLWFASGTACAFLFMRGFRTLWGVGIGSLAAYYFAGASIVIACSAAILWVAQGYFLLWLSYRYVSPTIVFYQRSVFIKFLFIASMLTASTTFLFEHVFSHPINLLTMLLKWLANLDGLLIFGCAIVALDFYFPQIDEYKKLNKLMLMVAFGILLIFIAALVVSSIPAFVILFALGIGITIHVIGSYYGWCGMLAALFLTGLVLSLAAVLQAPLFATTFAMQTCLYLQVLLLIVFIGERRQEMSLDPRHPICAHQQ